MKMKLIDIETYTMRTSAEYRGDRVERRVRSINGARFEFTRVQWGSGGTTVSASYYGRTETLHKFESEA